MDSTMEWDEIKNLSVRIAVATGTAESLVGTGVLYRRGFKEPALILTAAHVLDDAKENPEQEKQYYFDCADSEKKGRRIVCSLKMGEKILIHPDYDKDSKENDVAAFVVPWEEWMKDLPSVLIGSGRGKKEHGWGFPEGMNTEYRESKRRAGMADLDGEKNAYESDIEYILKHDLPNPTKTRENTMVGYSGTGLFEESNIGIRLVGLVSRAAGDETAGGRLMAADAHAIVRMLQFYKIEISLPDSLNQYRDLVIDELGRRKEVKGLFLKSFKALVNNEELTPKCLLENDKGAKIELKCNERRECCLEYWKGQLLWRTFLKEIWNKTGRDLIQPRICVQYDAKEHSDTKDPEAVYICAEESEETVICKLIQENYFGEKEKLADRTIVLLNGKDPKLCECMMTRGECRRMIQDIAGEYEYRDQDEFVKKTRTLLKNENEGDFDIIKGQLNECNLAVLGIGKIRQMWKEGNGDKEKMKRKMEGVVKEIWEE